MDPHLKTEQELLAIMAAGSVIEMDQAVKDLDPHRKSMGEARYASLVHETQDMETNLWTYVLFPLIQPEL
jgi:hypothetical protein